MLGELELIGHVMLESVALTVTDVALSAASVPDVLVYAGAVVVSAVVVDVVVAAVVAVVVVDDEAEVEGGAAVVEAVVEATM